MQLKKLGIGVGWTVLATVLAVNFGFAARIHARETRGGDREAAYEKMALFTKVIEQVREMYVDTNKVAYTNLIYGAMRGMLQSLDPHSAFLDPATYKDMKDDTSGQFGGLGIFVGMKDGLPTVISPMEDTPGFRAGILPGDKIIEVDGKTTEGLALDDVVKKMRGPPGSKVVLRLMRPKTQALRTVEVVRAEINVPSVKDAQLLEDGIGYVRVLQFSEHTADDLQKALDTLNKQGLRALVLDLRNNPGGLLASAVEVSQKFLRKGDLVVSTVGRTEKQLLIEKAGGRVHYLDFPMAILVNGGSASAAEIVSGALQDQHRAFLVGEKTFGKGSVQSVIPLDDGSALKLTTAKYYTPGHRVIHEHGIEPDIVVAMPPEDFRKLWLQRQRPKNPSPTEEAEAEARVTDGQLERAVDALKGVL
ncbi:MAG: S41 family peptidase, partial [Kiritimatiellaeota bacterium]|nr:S41 family peptidase [Kiritimatiellota bacterium]